MAQSNNTLWIVLGAIGGVLVLGCLVCAGVGYFVYTGATKAVREAADRTQRSNDLKQLGIAMHNYHDDRKQFPAKLDDLGLLDSKVREHVRNGDIEVIWDAGKILSYTEGTSNVILAWDTKALPNGDRLVLFMDGSVRPVTASEFQTQPKARATWSTGKK
jgi:hypothetical protein